MTNAERHSFRVCAAKNNDYTTDDDDWFQKANPSLCYFYLIAAYFVPILVISFRPHFFDH